MDSTMNKPLRGQKGLDRPLWSPSILWYSMVRYKLSYFCLKCKIVKKNYTLISCVLSCLLLTCYLYLSPCSSIGSPVDITTAHHLFLHQPSFIQKKNFNKLIFIVAKFWNIYPTCVKLILHYTFISRGRRIPSVISSTWCDRKPGSPAGNTGVCVLH